jgi:hypothetical protein
MTQQSDNAPGTTLFPDIGNFHSMLSQELEGLTDEQLDFTSDKWAWAEWSIRRNASHVSSGGLRWVLGRWADANLAEGIPLPDDAMEIVNSGARWLDEEKYHTVDSILLKLKEGLDLCDAVLAKQTVGSMHSMELPWSNTGQAAQMAEAHPNGRRLDPSDPEKAYIDLEYTFRHLWFEAMTHLYNIQRLKRAQGLSANVQLPDEGYHTIPSWDSSEP